MNRTTKLAIKIACHMVLMLCPLSAFAQVPVTLSPTAKAQFLSNAGIPLAAGCVFTYQGGTTNLQASYTDSTGLSQNTNPIILDAGGFANIWLTNQTYKFKVVTAGGVNCATGVTQYTVDGITGQLGLLSLTNTWANQQTFSQPIIITPTTNQIVVGTSPNQTTLNFPAPAGAKTLTFPNITDTMVARTTTDSLSNKTFIASATANPSLTGFVRLANQDFVKSRNATNTGDVALIGQDSQGFIDVGDAAGTLQLLGGTIDLGGTTNFIPNGPSNANNGFSITLTASNGNGLGVHAGGNVNLAAGLPVNGGVPGAVQVTVGSLKLGVNVIPFSLTPVFDLSKGNVQQFNCTTPTAAITPSMTNVLAGESFTLIFIQNSATACTLTYPGTMHGGTTLSSTLSSINVQEFIVSNNGTDAYAKSAASSTTGGTP